MASRADRHNNPAAFTTDIARQGGLEEGIDYEKGDPFEGGRFHTAKLLKDPVTLTIKVIDKIGFFTKSGAQRWVYVGIPDFVWNSLHFDEKKRVIGWMYKREGGEELKSLFV